MNKLFVVLALLLALFAIAIHAQGETDEPAPTEPAPTEPTPTEPAPTEPTPTEPETPTTDDTTPTDTPTDDTTPTETPTDDTTPTETPTEPVLPEAITLSHFIFDLTVPQTNVEGAKLWDFFITAFKASPDCGLTLTDKNYLNTAANLYNTQHRLYVNNLPETCTDAHIEDFIELANDSYEAQAGAPEEPTEPKPTEPEPTEPEPTEPKPTEPEPTEPTPTEPVVEPEAVVIKSAKVVIKSKVAQKVNIAAKEEVITTPSITKFVREKDISLKPELCWDSANDTFFCMAHDMKCNVKCPVTTKCTKDIQCGSSVCDFTETKLEDGKFLRFCTSNASAASFAAAIAVIVVAMFF